MPKHAAGSYTLTFTSVNARDDQSSVTSQLRKCVEAFKARSAPAAASPATPSAAPKKAQANGGASGSIAMAQTVTAALKADEAYDDGKLLDDLDLQRSLIQVNPLLRNRFERALADKPDSVTLSQFSNQFWSTRVHMLRSHATERSQTIGDYNVLSVVKPVNRGDHQELNITKEQIILIFKQHPVVRQAYNDLVPPLEEGKFWERFYNSRLIKKLKGERIDEDRDITDPKLDKYLNYDERSKDSQDLMDSIPLFINIEGNEQNHSQRLGNRPDFTMNPSSNEKAPILRILNSMSKKILDRAPMSDTNRHGPSGVDEQTYKELRLRDLQRADDDNRVVLQVQDQSRFFSAGQSLQSSTSAAVYTKRTPSQTLSVVRRDFSGINPGQNPTQEVDLHTTLGVEDDSSSDEEDATEREKKVGSKFSRTAATSQIMTAIKRRNLHDDDYIYGKTLPISEQAKKLALSESTLDSLTMTHNTTVEFLHYFWTVFYSGDPERANEVAQLIKTLDKSLDRLKAVADTAEAERTAILEKYKRDVEAYNARSGKKRKYDPENIKGGRRTVDQVAEPLVRAIGTAREEFSKALQEQTKSAIGAAASI